MDETILKVRDLDMHFAVGTSLFGKPKSTMTAVDGVSFDVRRGETFGVVGESGSGKTTLGRCIMRILQPARGSIEFRGKDEDPVDLTGNNSERLSQVWRDIRMIFQDPQSSLNPRLPVIEIVGQCLRKSEKLGGQALADRVAMLLKQVGMRPEVLHRYPGAFSGGQRQRIGIARALATNPQLVVADEAVSALDVSIQAQTLNLMQDLQEQFDLTYIFIAHDLAVVEHICDTVAVMYLGQFVERASKTTLFKNPQHPYTRALLSAVPVPDPRARQGKRRRLAPRESSTEKTACRFAPRCPHATDICKTQAPPRKRIGDTDVLCHFAGEI